MVFLGRLIWYPCGDTVVRVEEFPLPETEDRSPTVEESELETEVLTGVLKMGS